jgi:hypothetical protein
MFGMLDYRAYKLYWLIGTRTYCAAVRLIPIGRADGAEI